MTALTLSAALMLASTCQNVLDPQVIVGIAQHESGLNPGAVNTNKDGSRDLGLMQISEKNFAWLGLTAETAMDPCQSIAAAAKLMASYSRYNTGNSTSGVTNGYVANVTNSVRAVKGMTVAASPTPQPRPPPLRHGIFDQPADDQDTETLF